MRLATIKLHGAEVAGIVTGKGILPVAALNAYKGTGWKEDMMSLIQANHIPGLTKWYNEGGKEELETIPGVVPAEEVVYAPLYRNPKRIFGIGLNYPDHAKDIGNAAPTGFPGSFFKMADTLIGPYIFYRRFSNFHTPQVQSKALVDRRGPGKPSERFPRSSLCFCYWNRKATQHSGRLSGRK